MPDVWLSVFPDALERNYRRMARLLPQSEIAAVVKADAYGLGVKNVVPALDRAGCGAFFVNRFEEALNVRRLTRRAVYVLDVSGVEEGPEDYERFGFIPVFSNKEALNRFSEARNIAVRADIGLNMAGIPARDTDFWIETAKSRGVSLLVGHLSCSENPSSPENKRQLQTFERLASLFPDAKKSLAASYGAFLGKEYCFDLIRAGAALYGASVLPEAETAAMMTARVGRLDRVLKGQNIGYGDASPAQKDMLVATLLCGSGDGIVHKKGCFVVFNGKKLPVVASPTTNYLAVDASEVENEIRCGSEADLFNDVYTPDELAKDAEAGTGADVLIRLSPALKKGV